MTERVPTPEETEFVSPAWVETKLDISRPTRLELERVGKLHPIRLTPTAHRKYRRAEIEALAEGGEPR